MDLVSSECLHLAARSPVDNEVHHLLQSQRHWQKPKWYQYKALHYLDTPWLSGLFPPGALEPRTRLILADEGGVGKTKGAGLCINRYLSNYPRQPVIVLCPRRVIGQWREELWGLMRNRRDKIMASENGSAKNDLRSPLPGHVYVVSKHSFAKHYKELKKNWGSGMTFSLTVIDEAHQGKDDGSKSPEDHEPGAETEGHTQLKFAIKGLCHSFSDRVLALTASPLSLEIRELVDLAKRINVDPDYLKLLEKAAEDKDKEEHFLRDWSRNLRPVRDLLACEASQVDEKRIRDFLEHMIDEDQLHLLPFQKELEREFDFIPSNQGWLDESTRRAWLEELNPLSPFLSATLRSDLGEQADEMFRTRATETYFVQLHKDHFSRIEEYGLNEEKVDIRHRQPLSWPTNKFGPDQGVEIYEDVEFDYEEGKKKGWEDACQEPRLRCILENIIPMDPVLRDSKEKRACRGAVIFCDYLRTVDQIHGWLDGEKIQIQDVGMVTIKAHKMTGADDNAVGLNKKIDEYESATRGEYNVVVGTSAIQEGMNFLWATTVIHWDMPTNPQMLEQRTWRLDRHKRADYSSKFHVIYLVTDAASDRRLVNTICERAELASTLLGGTFDDRDWPRLPEAVGNSFPMHSGLGYTGSHNRSYLGKARPFINEEIERIAAIWDEGIDPQSNKVRREQQESILTGLGRSFDWGLDESELHSKGTITASNLRDPDSVNAASLRRLSILADNDDLMTLRLIHPTSPGERSHSLRLLGTKGPRGKPKRERRFEVSIDPSGMLLRRILRRMPESGSHIKGPREKERVLVFSIDCVDPLNNHLHEIRQLEMLIGGEISSLMISGPEGGPPRNLQFNSDKDMLKTMLARARSGKTADSSPFQDELRNQLKMTLDNLQSRTQSKLKQIETEIKSKDKYKEELEIRSRTEDSRHLQRWVELKIASLENQEKEIWEWDNHLETAFEGDFYRANLRYVEGVR